MKRLKLIIFPIILFTISCSESGIETTPPELLNTLWVLEAFEVNGIKDIPPDNQLYNIQFKVDNSLVGQNDCNSFFGEYVLKSNSITINNLITTEVYCGKESMDYRYFEALKLAGSYRIENNKLTIYFQSNSKLIFFGE